MGRPRIHNTLEEKRAANRAKSKRSYEKNKAVISAQRSLRHWAHVRVKTAFPARFRTEQSSGHADLLHREFCLAHQAAQTPRAFVEHVYHTYALRCDTNYIHDTICETTNLQTILHNWEGEILQLDGIGPALKNVQTISGNISRVVNSLEEFLCLAMTDYSDLARAYERGDLLFFSW